MAHLDTSGWPEHDDDWAAPGERPGPPPEERRARRARTERGTRHTAVEPDRPVPPAEAATDGRGQRPARAARGANGSGSRPDRPNAASPPGGPGPNGPGSGGAGSGGPTGPGSGSAGGSGGGSDGVAGPGTPAPVQRGSRAGRNLPAAIGVGLTLGAVVIASLFVWRPAFLGVVTIAVGIGIWEMTRAVEHRGPHAPLLPLLAGAVVMEALAWYDGAESLILGLVLTVLATLVWRLADGVRGYQRDLAAAALIAVYVPFLAGFAVLLARPDDGALRVIVTLACVVLSDTGGYAAGVFFGKHPMAPTVSPKKSWEGLAGSVVCTAVGAAILFLLVLDLSWWQGLVFGAAVSIACVLGDLGESLLKRDLGVKDMSNLLPGHGGMMDRLDSIVFAAPVAYALLTAFSRS